MNTAKSAPIYGLVVSASGTVYLAPDTPIRNITQRVWVLMTRSRNAPRFLGEDLQRRIHDRYWIS